MPDETAEIKMTEQRRQIVREPLLWGVEFDRKVGALSLGLQLGLSGKVDWRKD